jgi:hypothetical protein
MKSLTIIFLILNTNISAQIITLKFFDSNGIVPYVNIYDSLNNIYKSSDETGCIKLKSRDYNIIYSHVSYITNSVHILPISHDTIITIYLIKREIPLNDILIKMSLKKKNNEIFELGDYNKKTNSSLILKEDLKIGCLIDVRNAPPNSLLRSIKFKLKDVNLSKKRNYLMEVKIFAVKNGFILPSPLNHAPLYVKSASLNKKNELLLKELIKLPSDHLFISFELPAIFDDKNTMLIHFIGDYTADQCATFIRSNTKNEWDENTLLTSNCLHEISNRKYFSINLGITYQTN